MSYPTLPSPVALTHRGRRYEIRAEQDVEADRNRYSKSWHRQYGPAYEVTARRGALVLIHEDGTESKRTAPLDSFRGDWARRTVEAVLPGALASYDAEREAERAAAPPPPPRIYRKALREAGACDSGITEAVEMLNRINAGEAYARGDSYTRLRPDAASWKEEDVTDAFRLLRHADPDFLPSLAVYAETLRKAGYEEAAEAAETAEARRAQRMAAWDADLAYA